jgi:hypothetical protein
LTQDLVDAGLGAHFRGQAPELAGSPTVRIILGALRTTVIRVTTTIIASSVGESREHDGRYRAAPRAAPGLRLEPIGS